MSAILFDARQANGMPEEEVRAAVVPRGRRRKINKVAVTVFCGGGLMFLLARGLGWPAPDSPAVWVAGALAGFIWANGFEYFYHRFLLHRPGGMHARHHLRHHATSGTAGAAEHIALGGSPLRIVALYAINSIPIVAVDSLLGLGISMPVLAAFTAYLLCVEEIHWRLHMNRQLPRWLRSAKDRHEMHDNRPGRCFNIFLPMFDWIFGTLYMRG